MKKLFLKRHSLFFATLSILIICQIMILRNCLNLYKNKIIQKENTVALTQTLNEKTKNLPENHIDAERAARLSISKYKKFISETWPKMKKLHDTRNSDILPPNHVALFFEISDYLTWAKESCDSFSVEYEPTCSFGFRDLFEKNEQPLTNEIYDIHQQKEQLKLLMSYLLEARSSYLKIISIERGDISHSNYFRNNDVFATETNEICSTKSYTYKIKFTTFTNSFRNFIKNIYENEIPVIFREIDIRPNYTFKLTKNSPDQILECLATTFSLTIEFLDTPSFSQNGKQNAAIRRKILYWTAP